MYNILKELKYLDIQVHRRLSASVSPFTKRLNFTQANIIRYLSEHDGLATQNELVTYLGLKKPSVTAVLKDLENRGLIIRYSDPDDLRRNYIALSKTAKQKTHTLYTSIQSLNKQLIRGIPEQELKDFLGTIHKMLKNMEVAFDETNL